MNIIYRNNKLNEFNYFNISNEHKIKHNNAFIENIDMKKNYTDDFTLIYNRYQVRIEGHDTNTLFRPVYINIKTNEKLTYKDYNEIYLCIQLTMWTSYLIIPLYLCDMYQNNDNEYIFNIPSNMFFNESINLIYRHTAVCEIKFNNNSMTKIQSISLNYDISYYNAILNLSSDENSCINMYNTLGSFYVHSIKNNSILYDYNQNYRSVLSTHLYIKMNKNDYKYNLLSIKLILDGKDYFELSTNYLNSFKKIYNTHSNTLYFFIPIIDYKMDNNYSTNLNILNYETYTNYKKNFDRTEVIRLKLDFSNIENINKEDINIGVMNVCIIK